MFMYGAIYKVIRYYVITEVGSQLTHLTHQGFKALRTPKRALIIPGFVRGLDFSYFIPFSYPQFIYVCVSPVGPEGFHVLEKYHTHQVLYMCCPFWTHLWSSKILREYIDSAIVSFTEISYVLPSQFNIAVLAPSPHHTKPTPQFMIPIARKL